MIIFAISSLLALLFCPSALAQWFNTIGVVGVDAADSDRSVAAGLAIQH